MVSVDRDTLHACLREMAPTHLKPAMRKDWTTEHPTRNFCYVVTEWLCKILWPNDLTGWSVEVPGDTAKHYFATIGETVSSPRIDLTAEQFAEWDVVPYSAAKRARFMPPSPSKRARVLAELYDSKRPPTS